MKYSNHIWIRRQRQRKDGEKFLMNIKEVKGNRT